MCCFLGSLASLFLRNASSLPASDEEFAVRAFLAAGFCEETFKLLFIGSITLFHDYYQSPHSIIQASIAAALGFTAVP